MMSDTELEEFFGRPEHQVSPLVLRIAAFAETQPPEWLRGKFLIRSLPRYSPDALPHDVEGLSNISTERICEQIVQIVEEFHEPWTLRVKGFQFASLTEAIYFKMRWS